MSSKFSLHRELANRAGCAHFTPNIFLSRQLPTWSATTWIRIWLPVTTPTSAPQREKVNSTMNTTQGVGKWPVTQLSKKKKGFLDVSGQMLKTPKLVSLQIKLYLTREPVLYFLPKSVIWKCNKCFTAQIKWDKGCTHTGKYGRDMCVA